MKKGNALVIRILFWHITKGKYGGWKMRDSKWIENQGIMQILVPIDWFWVEV